MSFFLREWTDAEKWIMGIVSAVILSAGGAWWASLEGEVAATVASRRYQNGRCIDTEVFVRNESKADATEIEIAFDVDYFTKQGSLLLEYGDERSQLIATQDTLLPHHPYIDIANTMDQKRSVLTIPVLKPGQYVHLFFGGETVVDSSSFSAREKLLAARSPELMNKPRVLEGSRKNGRVRLDRAVNCAAV